MSEWFKVLDCKSCVGNTTAGSNPATYSKEMARRSGDPEGLISPTEVCSTHTLATIANYQYRGDLAGSRDSLENC